MNEFEKIINNSSIYKIHKFCKKNQATQLNFLINKMDYVFILGFQCHSDHIKTYLGQYQQKE